MSAPSVRAAAGAARKEAQLLRARSSERRVELRRHSARAEFLRASCRSTCSTSSRAREAWDRVSWSDLPWRAPEAEFDDVLVLLDGD